jgi:hypothetical protein
MVNTYTASQQPTISTKGPLSGEAFRSPHSRNAAREKLL